MIREQSSQHLHSAGYSNVSSLFEVFLSGPTIQPGRGAIFGVNTFGGRYLENADSIVFIRQFIEACATADPDEFASYFSDDAIWWNSPWRAVEGRAAIRETLRQGAERMTALPWEIRHIVADGDVVMTERVDHFLVENKRISVPCMGTFELRNGKIAAWRDYWDLGAC